MLYLFTNYPELMISQGANLRQFGEKIPSIGTPFSTLMSADRERYEDNNRNSQ